MSWNLLERFLDSEHFNKDPSLTVAYLARYAEHVGIHFVLCSKLRQFSYEEIEFFLPQLCHLLISIDNDSMALEEFIIDLCEESVNGALLTFWLFQTYLHDLSSQPASNAFQTCRRVYNKVQRIVFGGAEPLRRERIQENVLPVTVLSSLVLASVGVPLLAQHVAPLAVAQSRRPRPLEDVVSESIPQSQPQKLGRSRTVTGSTTTARREVSGSSNTREGVPRRTKRPAAVNTNGAPTPRTQPNIPRTDAPRRHAHRQSLAVMTNHSGYSSSSSLPDDRKQSVAAGVPVSPGVPRRPSEMARRHSQAPKPARTTVSAAEKVPMLRQNYFRSETQFLTALEGISSRLVGVPKQARLSALRAELALIAQDLPAEVDIPTICPPTLVDGIASRSRHHRIVRLNPAEATSLNSAEKVPYLLMLEVLREDFDFDPDSEQNEQLLATILADKGRSKRRLFDTSDAARESSTLSAEKTLKNDSVLEPASGDLSSAALLQDLDGQRQKAPDSPLKRPVYNGPKDPPRLSNGFNTMSTVSLETPRNSGGPISRSSSPGQRPSPYTPTANPNQAEVSALADHMRTASQMLAQLELSAAKRPKTEVAAIKAKIIASMQSLEEQSFLTDDGIQGPNFDTIMNRATEEASHIEPSDLEGDDGDQPTDPKINTGRGADRMENDFKTGGIQRKGDRDDPSAATFGEAWEQKKERIRRSSPYGWAKNWDLISVIVKTGDDLRQEAFACQLIGVCSKIWSEHNIDVWVKTMRILVTGESSGLIETITSAVSLHSLKRSLTLASITAGSNPKKRIATLQDHFSKTFGAPDSPSYLRAIDCFVKSLAAYSIISYILQLKDRHNGNILIDSDGHMIHIDFGFMLSNSPGNMGFEAAPFKLTFEYVEVLGGVEGEAFIRFKELLKDAFQALRREAERIVTLVELMGRESKMACYAYGLPSVVSALRARFVLEKSKEEAREWVEDLVTKSLGSYYTRLYDTFQYRTQGIY
ncbi:Phosphatidylinositol 4-kinase pik1alpha (PI4-kinase)(PtdIns-4-kinase) [Saxophila tyrrhenica]|uniref:1-phosphatidylinositol 4-kinase n=1 Tax=Saxophila tyrrhenica TaxID=1690608 RepID=A0AAV9PPQ6_9PEZI|nr:Phosphatidylinositol 4-kinase pik1alpha (PI4-kinase)(PtdIns-4-kinase) [Saxophila tyrrhenica]